MAISSIAKAAAVYQDSATTVQKSEAKATTTLQNAVSQVEAAVYANTKTVVGSGVTENNTDQNSEEQARQQHLKAAISTANNKMKHAKTRCEFSYHESTNRISIKVLDTETQEVIREIPAEDTLKMIEKIWEIAGILVDERR